MTLLSYLQNNPLAFMLSLFLLGLVAGSFLNVVIHRLPIMMERDWREQCSELMASPSELNIADGERYDLIAPRSRCPACAHPIAAWQNIPLLSYVLIKGRCSSCGQAISSRYPVVELTGGLLAAAMAWHFGFSWQAMFATLLSWGLLSLSVIDFDTQLLPDSITLPLLWLGLACNLFGLYTDLESAVIGAIAGYMSLWTVYQVFKLLTGKEGMGFGDFKLLALLGAWMGWQVLPVVIILSSLVGAVVGIALIALRDRGRDVPIPFGPYLAAAGWIALIWGTEITERYLAWAAPP